MMPFVGRTHELHALNSLATRGIASLVVMKGRRRIGKSRLVEEFAKRFGKGMVFYNFSGLPPTPITTTQDQLDEFSRQLSYQTGLPEVKVDDWSKLFILLAEKCQQGRTTILLDEISWMGSKDPNFLGKLKNAWDLYFKKNPKLMLILCGSVSSWIEKNIVSSTGFLGRPSLYVTLEELALYECNLFWEKQGADIAAFEKFKVLSVTGGVPRYLELINPQLSAEENIKQLCFTKNSPLVNEFEHIFSDIFGKRSDTYKKIAKRLAQGSASANELAKSTGLSRTGLFDDYLNDLVLGGFIARDYTWHLNTEQLSKLSYYRLKDNYLRFYLKYIESNKNKIIKDLFRYVSLSSLSNWETILGLQFENLVLSNHHAVIGALGIRPEEVILEGPYFQRPTSRQPGCQIDYLIQTMFGTIYICEVKFSKHPIKMPAVTQVQEKVQHLKIPRHVSRRPVLIHVNGVSENVIDSGYFSHIIDFGDLLKTPY